MLDKLSGTFAPRPSSGPHKLRECLPLILLIRNRLKYALTKREVTNIVMQRLIKVDNKVRTDSNYPTGFMGKHNACAARGKRAERARGLASAHAFHPLLLTHPYAQGPSVEDLKCTNSPAFCPLDVVTIEKTGENFRILYDTKGRFTIHRISNEEAAYKLCKVKKLQVGQKAIPFVVTHDGRTIRYPDPLIRVQDTVRVNLESGKIEAFAKFEIGNIAMITGGHSTGRVGIITHHERHPGGFDIVHLKDAR